MSLRPRYSLLTFLLFTAAVVIGVKLWSGPQQRALNHPFTEQDKELLNDLGYQSRIAELGHPHIVLESSNDLQGNSSPVMVGRFKEADQLPVHITGEYGNLLTRTQVQYYYEDVDFIASWICCLPAKEKLTALIQANTGPCGTSYMMQLEEANKVYLFTKQGRVLTTPFHFQPIDLLKLIELDSIPDPEIRARIERELAAVRKE